jgi:hypothetical protein
LPKPSFYLGARGGEGGVADLPKPLKTQWFFDRALFEAREASVSYVKIRGFGKVRPGRAPRRGPKRAFGTTALYVKTRGPGLTGPQRVPRKATKHQHKLTNTTKITEKRFEDAFGIEIEENHVKHVVWNDLR